MNPTLNKQTNITRFRWIAAIYVIVLVGILFVRYYTPYFTDKWDLVVWCASLGLTGWLYFDEVILQSRKYYLLSLILSLIHLIFAQIILHNIDTGFLKDLSMLQPLLLLVFQFPTRRFFIFLMKREPSTDRNANMWQDKIYCMIILCGSFLPLILYYIKSPFE